MATWQAAAPSSVRDAGTTSVRRSGDFANGVDNAGGLLEGGDPADILPERLLNGGIVEPVERQQDTRDALKECGDVIPKRTARLLYAYAPRRPRMTPSG
jgi:hypothetical protein